MLNTCNYCRCAHGESCGKKQSKSIGGTALHYAAEGGHDTCVTMLLQKGAAINCRDKKGRTPLMLACMSPNSADVVRTLVASAACDVLDRDDVHARTALHYSAAAGNVEGVELLLDAGEVDIF